jgi:hypothetical protein
MQSEAVSVVTFHLGPSCWSVDVFVAFMHMTIKIDDEESANRRSSRNCCEYLRERKRIQVPFGVFSSSWHTTESGGTGKHPPEEKKKRKKTERKQKRKP